MNLKQLAIGSLASAILVLATNPGFAQGTALTYQGRLDRDGVPSIGSFDLTFAIFNSSSGPGQVGATLTNTATALSNGLFTVTLDFGSGVFDGSSRWMEIGVVTNGGGAFTTLAPRQRVTVTPYAITASAVTGPVPAAQLTGSVPLAQLPAAVVTNGASGVNITGTFYGNAAGITNLSFDLASGGSIHPGSGQFLVDSSPTVGATAYSVAAADVNGDGKIDLISANNAANTLTVLTNNGSGGFVLASSPAVGSQPHSVIAADINGDGKTDLISANFNANTLSILTNTGTGAFVLASSPSVGAGPFCVIAVDVNGDNRMDLVTANYSASTLTVLTNNGSGGFVLSFTLSVGGNPESVTAADVNGDNKMDLISANATGNSLTVLTNNGNGGFSASSTLTGLSLPTSVTAADVNGDGKMDLVAANQTATSLSIFTNNGSGGFVLSTSPGVGAFPSSVVAADVDGDGQVDLITANGLTNTLSVLINNGHGVFAQSSVVILGSSPQILTTADVNGDGKADLISANGTANTLSVCLNAIGFKGFFTGVGQFSTASFGSASFGASLGPKLNLYSTLFGLGIQNSVLYSRVATGGGFGWFAGGVHNDNTFNAGGGSVLMTLTSGGLAVNGTFVSASDRNLKQDFADVNPREVLDKLAQLPIQSWAYKNDPNIRHLGPMAQDFYAAFAVGPDDKHITTVDEAGVTLAAIQALNEKLEKQTAENVELKKRLEKLERRLAQ